MYVYVLVYVVVHLCDIVLSIWVCVNLRRFFYCFFISILLLEIHYQMNPINRFNPTTFMCLSSTICRGFFVFNGLRLEMDVRFVDIIGGAVNHRFCFITCDFLLFSLYVWETRWVLYMELKKLDVFLALLPDFVVY